MSCIIQCCQYGFKPTSNSDFHSTSMVFCLQVVQLSMMLDALLELTEVSSEELECFFIEALYCSLGASLLDSGREKFDDFIKKLSCLTSVHDEKTLASPGELPGNSGILFVSV